MRVLAHNKKAVCWRAETIRVEVDKEPNWSLDWQDGSMQAFLLPYLLLFLTSSLHLQRAGEAGLGCNPVHTNLKILVLTSE